MERDFRPNRSFAAPVKVGDEFEVNIEGIGEKGDGIAKKDGFVIFVPNVKEGDNVKVKVTRVLRKVGFGEVVGEGSAPSGDAPSKESAPAEESTPEEAPAEDSEDFGEESEEEKKEE